MDDDEYYQKETYRIYKEEIKGIGITSLHYTINTENNEKYLCRFLNLKNYKVNSSLYDDLKKTIRIYHKYQNNNFINLYDVIQGTSNLYILYNYTEGKTLFKYKKEGRNFNEKEIKKILEEVLNALIHLYKIGRAHV